METLKTDDKIQQRSEALPTTLILTLSGGAQDAYSYMIRDHVFANAQTGNIVLFAANLVEGNISLLPHYMIPLLAFSFGILCAELIRLKYRKMHKIHWRQLVTILEVILLFSVAFIPAGCDSLANAMISFSCAMQVQAFRKFKGHAYASTMCIGNIRSAMDNYAKFLFSRNTVFLRQANGYLMIISTFFLGAALGALFCSIAKLKAIWISALLVAISCLIMNKRPEKKENIQ